MKYRPKALVFLSLILLCVGVSFPLQIAMIYEHTFGEFDAIWSKLTYLNQAVMFLCLVNAYLVFQGSRYALYATALLVPMMVWNNYWVGTVATDYNMQTTMIGSALFALAHGLMLVPNARAVLLNPKNRWWRTAPRRKVEIPMMVCPWLDKQVFSTATFDISESGAFLKLNVHGESKIPDNLRPNDFVEIRFNIAGYYQIRCSAKVVRLEKGKGNYPPGMGIQFSEMNTQDQKLLRRFVDGEMSL